MALVNLDTYYFIPNIHAGNNSLSYSPDWFPFTLRTGSYMASILTGDPEYHQSLCTYLTYQDGTTIFAKYE